MTRRRTPPTLRQAVYADHGGEMSFWLAWVHRDLKPPVVALFRTEARRDPALEEDIASVDAPRAADEVRNALEATNYLVARRPPPGLPADADRSELTDLTFKDRGGTARGAKGEVYGRVRGALYDLLAAVAIVPPAGGDESRRMAELMQHLAGQEAVGHFRGLCDWLTAKRRHLELAGNPAFAVALDRLLGWLTPECFANDGQHYLRELSYRLFLRVRLLTFCRAQGWAPQGSGAPHLESAFALLSRERIGALVRQALEEARSVPEENAVDPREPLQLLAATL